MALDLEEYDVVHARRGSFMSALGRGNAGFECDCNPLTCCCAGFGMCRQTISGAPGTAFVQATGTVLCGNRVDGVGGRNLISTQVRSNGRL